MKFNFKNIPFSNRSLILIMLLSLTIIFSALVSSYWRYNKTLQDFEWINQANDGMKEVMALKTRLYEEQSNVRAYIMTNDTQFLPDFSSEYRSTKKQFYKVKSLFLDDEIFVEQCDSLKPMIEKRYALFNQLMAAKDAGNDSVIRREVMAAAKLMEQLSALMDDMNLHKEKGIATRMTRAKTGVRLSPLFLLFASVVSFLFIIFSYLMLSGAYERSIQLQKELSENIKDLNRSNSELEQFAYVASHDLQEPLRKLRTFGNMLEIKEKEKLSQEGKELLERMLAFGGKMQRLIEDLLTFSRMASKSYEAVTVDLNRIVAEVKANLMDTRPSRRIIFQIEPLPVLRGFDYQLLQLFQNLINNSVKYSKPEGDIIIRIHSASVKGAAIKNAVKADYDRNFYKITVADNGIGFENKYADKIFVIFQRLHGKAEYEGTGIGLAICKRVVENHGGYIEASGLPGGGADICVYLPRT